MNVIFLILNMVIIKTLMLLICEFAKTTLRQYSNLLQSIKSVKPIGDAGASTKRFFPKCHRYSCAPLNTVKKE